MKSVSCSVMSDSLRSIPWNVTHQGPLSMGFSMDKNRGVGCHSLVQGIFPPRNWTHVSCITGRYFPLSLWNVKLYYYRSGEQQDEPQAYLCSRFPVKHSSPIIPRRGTADSLPSLRETRKSRWGTQWQFPIVRPLMILFWLVFSISWDLNFPN